MFNHFLIFIALLSFSIATTAAAVPMDVGQAALNATQNADLHRDVMEDYQGGNSDKDVTTLAPPAPQPGVSDTHAASSVSPLFSSSQETRRVHPLAILLVSAGVIVLLVSRNSSSTK
ncbi:hypothetical protein [Cellvibrio sp. pealriver]|uniref:hypothetical protein n=1 Tax=Cellvibrio sp. pealriver TaxID=1622269 RepID=UPI00066FD021|nr:hypothetical protein [Cellvibrio sp. pealriver]